VRLIHNKGMDLRSRAGLACLILTVAMTASAQTPKAPETWTSALALPGVDFTGLSAAQKQKAIEMLRAQPCTCTCGMKVAECRFKDQDCSYSKGLSTVVVKGLKEGKSDAEIAKLETASRWGHPPAPPKLLEDPVKIPLTGSPALGPASAAITLVEFSDFECPYCSRAAAEVKTVLDAHPKDIRLVYKQFPLETHPHAQMAAMAALAAMNQDKFWPMHDKLFANFRKLTRENILTWAQELGLDMPRFTADLASPKLKGIVQNDVKDGLDAGVTGTPSFYINGKHYNGPFTMAALKPIFDEQLKGKAGAVGSAR